MSNLASPVPNVLSDAQPDGPCPPERRSLGTAPQFIRSDADGAEWPIRRFASKLLTGVLTTAASAILDLQIKGQWSSWARVLVVGLIAALGLYLLVSAAATGRAWWNSRRAVRRIELQARAPLLACATMFAETMSPSFAKSAGNVLDALHGVKALDARVSNAYHMQIGTLANAGRYLLSDLRSERLSSMEGWQRLSELHGGYLRLCREIASAVSRTERTDVRRSWDEIRDHANMMSYRLTQLGAQVREHEAGGISHPYFESVPRAW
jgi:hypothetical protein